MKHDSQYCLYGRRLHYNVGKCGPYGSAFEHNGRCSERLREVLFCENLMSDLCFELYVMIYLFSYLFNDSFFLSLKFQALLKLVPIVGDVNYTNVHCSDCDLYIRIFEVYSHSAGRGKLKLTLVSRPSKHKRFHLLEGCFPLTKINVQLFSLQKMLQVFKKCFLLQDFDISAAA